MKQELEARFGTETAMGIVYTWTNDQGAVVVTDPSDTRSFPGYDCESTFPDGLPATCCTWYAVQIGKQYPGRVTIYGFHNENNPESRIAREKLHPGGHDFAVIDNRWLVDPWLRHVAGQKGEIVFDLWDGPDSETAFELYGPMPKWEHNTEAELSAKQ